MSFKYGDFTEDGAFRIDDPDTPKPWINYLTNGDYCALTSQHGGGFSFFKDPSRHGILRREMSGFQRDCPGRFFYVMDEQQQVVWSPNRVPMTHAVEFYECLHEPGVTTITSGQNDLEVQIRYFVPPDENHEIWQFRIRNTTNYNRQLRVVSVAEWLLGNTRRDALDRQWDLLHKEVKYDPDLQTIRANKRHWEREAGEEREIRPWPYEAYKTTTREPESWEISRDVFFGSYRGYHNPEALEHANLGENEVIGGDAIGAFDWNLELPGSSEEQWSCIVGINRRDEDLNVRSFQTDDYARKALDRTRDFWDQRTGDVQVSLPDNHLQHLVNTWLPVQVSINTWFGRAPSYWHSSQGYTGFRDACHEAFGVSPIDAEDAREKLEHILSFTYENGLNSHRTPRGARDYDQSDNADDPLWVPLGLSAYLRETGDWEFLEEEIGYLDSEETATVLDHMIEGIEYVLTQRGETGLPLIRYGDWNDALDTVGEEGEGESVWIGEFLCLSLVMAAQICEEADRVEVAEDFRHEAAELKQVINDECWDGDWYLRAFTDDGEPIGSRKNDAGKIWLNSQTWAVLSGIANEDRARRAFENVQSELDTRWGYRYFAPAYQEIDPEIGVITQFVPGNKENGSIFSHAAGFALVALGELGMGEEMFDLWHKISPTTHVQQQPDLYGLEPYVYCQNVTGPDSPDFGEGNYHWLSGTASWVYRAVTDYLIGFRPDYNGVRIDPCLPPHWDEVEITRSIRGVEWTVTLHQEDEGNTTVEKMIVDGEQAESDQILIPYPDPEDQDERHVEVYLK